jgi:flagellar biosynthesis protein FlhF
MNATASGTTDGSNLYSETLEARLAHLEELVGDIHGWMHSELVALLPPPYRRLFAQLIANDFDARFATQLTRSLYSSIGTRDVNDEELRARAAKEVGASVACMDDSVRYKARANSSNRPFVLALVGPSGAGKTTLMFKLAVRAVLNGGLKVKIVSSDTYKIGSVEAIRTIADILDVPFGVAYSPDEVVGAIDNADADLVILDTAGRADRAAREELEGFIAAARPDETHLVLSATTGARALQETAALFLGERINYATFTKLDEAPSLGALISAVHWMSLPIGYVSTGTAIPDDLLASAEVPIGEWAVDGIPQLDHSIESQHV